MNAEVDQAITDLRLRRTRRTAPSDPMPSRAREAGSGTVPVKLATNHSVPKCVFFVSNVNVFVPDWNPEVIESG